MKIFVSQHTIEYANTIDRNRTLARIVPKLPKMTKQKLKEHHQNSSKENINNNHLRTHFVYHHPGPLNFKLYILFGEATVATCFSRPWPMLWQMPWHHCWSRGPWPVKSQFWRWNLELHTSRMLLLMVQKSGDHQLRERYIVYPSIYEVLYIPSFAEMFICDILLQLLLPAKWNSQCFIAVLKEVWGR